MSNLACPISSDRLDQNTARVVAFFVIAISVVALYLNSWLLFVLLGADFALRAFGLRRFSPLRWIAKWLTTRLGIPEKLTDAAPKQFAAGVGLFFSLGIAALLALSLVLPAQALAGVLLLCALLEGALGFCVGCLVYSTLVLPFLRNKPEKLPEPGAGQ